MTPTPEQMREAARNHQRPGRTPGGRIRQALEHAQSSQAYAEAVRLARLVQSVQP